jgi:hypothetical protein
MSLAPVIIDAEQRRSSPFVRYDVHGEVTEWGRMSVAAIERDIEAGLRTAKGGGTEHHWVDLATGLVSPKVECAAYLDGMVIRGCPIPCRVHIGRDTYVCEDGTAELEFTQPGTYSVTIKSVRYLPKTFAVVVP